MDQRQIAQPESVASLTPIVNSMMPDSTIDFKRYYLYGFLVNLVPLYAFYPIRTAKTLQQANIGTTSSTSLQKVFVERVRSEGLRGLYKGISVYGLGSICGRLVHFATYDALRERVYKGNGGSIGLKWLEGCSPTTINAVLGTISAITTSSFMVPFDVISQQQQVSKQPTFCPSSAMSVTQFDANHAAMTSKRSMSTTLHSTYFMPGPPQPRHSMTMPIESPPRLNLLSRIIRLKPKEVPLHRWLYRGWSAALLNTVSFFPSYFFVYTYALEQLRTNAHLLPFLPKTHFFLSVTAGVASGVTATIVSAPFDVVKTRIQIERKAGRADLRWLNMARATIRTEGLRGLFVGMSARLWIIVPLGSLNFWVFEKVRDWSTVKVKRKDDT